MEVGTPGNMDKGFCLKCKTPLVLELIDRIQFLCTVCVRDVAERVVAAKGNSDVKKFVLQPGQYRRVLPDGSKTPLVVQKKR